MNPDRSQDRLSSEETDTIEERRRPSVSRARKPRRAEHQPKEEAGAGRVDYVSPNKIIDIFGEAISPDKLCALSEMEMGSPSAVRKIMPEASAKQICQVVGL